MAHLFLNAMKINYFDDISFSTTKSKNTIPLTAQEKKDTLTWAMENFISGMMKSVPPLDEVFNMAGMQLPELLGKKVEGDAPKAD